MARRCSAATGSDAFCVSGFGVWFLVLHEPALGFTAGAFFDFFFFGGTLGTWVYPAFGSVCIGVPEGADWAGLPGPEGGLPDDFFRVLDFGLDLGFAFGSAKPALSN